MRNGGHLLRNLYLFRLMLVNYVHKCSVIIGLMAWMRPKVILVVCSWKLIVEAIQWYKVTLMKEEIMKI